MGTIGPGGKGNMNQRMIRIRSWVATLVLAVFGLTTMNWPMAAVAQDAGQPNQQATVLVLPMQRHASVSESVQTRIEEYLRALIEIDPKVRVVYFQPSDLPRPTPAVDDGTGTAGAQVATRTHPDIEKARAQSIAGREAALLGKYETALTRLMSAQKLFSRHLSDLEDFDLYLDAIFWTSVAFIDGGYVQEGNSMLNRVAVMKPTLAIDRKDFSKRFVEAFDRARARATTGGNLAVDVSPASASVYVDGRLIGTGAQKLSDLPRGKHFVRVTADGYIPSGKTVATGAPGKEDRAQVILRPRQVSKPKAGQKPKPKAPAPEGTALLPGARTGEFDDDFRRDAKAAADKAMTDFVLVSYLAQDDTTYRLGLFLFDARSSDLFEIDPATFDRDLSSLQIGLLEIEDRLSKAVTKAVVYKRVNARPAIYALAPSAPAAPKAAGAVAAPGTARAAAVPGTVTRPTAPVATSPALPPRTAVTRPAPARVPAPPNASSDSHWYQKWWVWTIAGVVVAGAGVGTYFLVKEKGGSSGFTGQAVW